MKTIQKYKIQQEQSQIRIPSDSILSVEYCDNEIFVYAVVDSEDMDERPYYFNVFETGQEMNVDINGYDFLGKVKTQDESVLHVFVKGISSMDF
jgi:hypothetical protein